MKITKTQALQIAKEECARREWKPLEPETVLWGFFNFHVRLGEPRGGHITMTIRKRDGEVLRAGWIAY